MIAPALRIISLSKQYVIGASPAGSGSFYELMENAVSAPLRWLKKERARTEEERSFWALKDVSFDVKKGDVIGILGRNGAGKSTLLKILSRITAPTNGRIEIRGRLTSLLEVGTGFHPELSGRENIYLNGAILGMTRTEISSRFDEIVAFAEIDRFVDTPVKRYSSGMYVRLAFAVAAHLETDVLLVDEVLAVGDAAFQKKSLGKMKDVAHQGRTVLFVSHNLGAVRNLCASALLLEGGRVQYEGPVTEGLARYERSFSVAGGTISPSGSRGPLAAEIEFTQLLFFQDHQSVTAVDPTRPLQIDLCGRSGRDFANVSINISVFRDGCQIASCHDAPPDSGLAAGQFVSRFQIPGGTFRAGRYVLGVGAYTVYGTWVWNPDAGVVDFSENTGGVAPERLQGAVSIPYRSERLQ